jgi:hypothetical protein
MVLGTVSGWGIIAVGVFLSLEATIASLAGTTLVWRGTILDRIWAINAPAYSRLAPFGKTVGIPFLLVGATLAVAIIAIQVMGDLVNALMGAVVRGGVGFVIAGGLLIYLLRPETRGAFVPRRVIEGVRRRESSQ